MKSSLQIRITLLVSFLTLLSLVAETFFIKRYLESHIVSQTENRVLSIATLVAEDPEIIEAFNLKEPSTKIQPLAEKVRLITGTSYVVVFNMETIRYSHPVPERIGQHFVGGDEVEALKGKRYVSKARGTLGLSLRAFVPIWNSLGRQIGVVSVGQLLSDLESESRKLNPILYSATAISLVIGAFGAFLLSRNIKKTLFGLEPKEIATLLEERNIIISSIKEGILAVDAQGQILLINENAKTLLGLSQVPLKSLVQELIPNTRLLEVIKTGIPDIDDEQVINNRILLVNRIPMFSHGKVIGAVATFRDMSEIRAMAEELTSVKLYVEGLRAQHHEFLNKLHVIAGLLQLKEYLKAVEFVLDTVTRDQKILDYLRSHIQVPAISGLLLAKINSARERNIDIEICSEKVFPSVREECVGPLVTILGNLLQNSIEVLASTSSKRKKIYLYFSETKDQFILKIQDTGPGIPLDIQDKIFLRGFTTKSGEKNQGIGLYLVKQQVELFGGTIQLQSGSKGTSFVLTIPKRSIVA